MIKETREKRKYNDSIRMEIIHIIMNIVTTESLKYALAVVKALDNQEFMERPMDIVDIANILDLPDIIRVLDAIDKADMKQIAAQQIKEAFSKVLDSWNAESEEE